MDRPTAPSVASPAGSSVETSPVDQLLARPPEQRLREQKYRCAQAIVFGLPVLGLQYFGRSLGGAEAANWVAGLQAILAGWVMYVGVTGMLFEAAVLLMHRRRFTFDLIVALAALALYVASIAQTIRIMTRASDASPWFHVCVLIVIVWSGWRWRVLSARLGESEEHAK